MIRHKFMPQYRHIKSETEFTLIIMKESMQAI